MRARPLDNEIRMLKVHNEVFCVEPRNLLKKVTSFARGRSFYQKWNFVVPYCSFSCTIVARHFGSIYYCREITVYQPAWYLTGMLFCFRIVVFRFRVTASLCTISVPRFPVVWETVSISGLFVVVILGHGLSLEVSSCGSQIIRYHRFY